MSVNALTAQGTTLSIGSGSPITYDPIPEISSFSGPGGAGSVIDVTDLDSEAMEKIMGLPDEGQLSFDINYLPDNEFHAALRTARAEQALTSFELTFSDETVWTFNAFVTGFSLTGGINAPIKAAVVLEISGAIEEA